nr:bifunctional phosphoglucose/phosphomannose isomerase [Thermoleophilaceae bacterium]
MGELTRAAIDALDSGTALTDTLGMDHQIGDALWRADAAQIATVERRDGLVICAMGGSAIGADLAFAAIGARARRPLTIVRGYEPPSWIGPETFVLAQSYSGNTEETLACFEAAGQAGATRAVLTTGGALAELARAQGVPVIGAPSGFQPRSAVAYGVVGALVCADLCAAAPSLRDEVDAAARTLTQLATEWG